ncbi:MAG: AAA family ATPase, partial [Caldilineales bacterium]|nr:AAA family ATPase [Caldilineales bacterium]
MLVPRPRVLDQINRLWAIHPIVALLGPRQCGKTTVARMLAGEEPMAYFDLENPTDVRRLSAPLTLSL